MDQLAAQPSIFLDDLPNEMIVAVLRQLELPDLIKCRSVSKWFRDLIDNQLKIRELFVFGDHKCSQYFYRRTPNLRYLLKKQRFNILESLKTNYLSMSLKSFAIGVPIINIAHLNEFRNLERLYIEQVFAFCDVTLSLKKLKVLFIDEISMESSSRARKQVILTVDSMVLQKLNCRMLCKVRLTNYDGVKHLTAANFQQSYFGEFKNKYWHILLNYKMVQTLKINWGLFEIDAFVNTIFALENLTELHFNWESGVQKDLDQIPKRIWAKKSGLRIFYNNVELIKENWTSIVDRRYAGLEDVSRMQIEHCQYFCVSELCLETFYCDIAFDGQPMPDDLLSRFYNIRAVHSGVISETDRFVRFVNSCKHLNRLELNITGLERDFLGRLSLNQLSFHSLTLTGERADKDGFDYTFVYKLEYLWSLRIRYRLDRETLLSFFSECKHLIQLFFIGKRREKDIKLVIRKSEAYEGRHEIYKEGSDYQSTHKDWPHFYLKYLDDFLDGSLDRPIVRALGAVAQPNQIADTRLLQKLTTGFQYLLQIFHTVRRLFL